jgi:PadR family transcriptional regulator AphA
MCPMVRRPPGIELALLGFLRKESLHAYQIHQLLSDSVGLGAVWHLKQSQLYALLAKLEKDGLIKGEIVPQEDARPPRRMLQVTRRGHAAYQEWLQAPVSVPRQIRQEFMAKLFFASKERGDIAKELVNHQRLVCQTWLKFMITQNDKDLFNMQLDRYRMGQIEAVLKWLETLY